VRVVAILAAIGFTVLALFQAALAAGAPLGRAAWGGTDAKLRRGRRIASALATAIFVLALLVILRRSGLRATLVPFSFARWATIVLVGVMALSAFANVASKSRWERYLWAPTALTLAIFCLSIALSNAHPLQWG
jgi:hypothetical protein